MDAPSPSPAVPAAESPYQPWHFWYCCALALGGVVCVIYGYWLIRQAQTFAAHAVTAQASVVSYKVRPPDKHGGTTYQPIVRFVDPAGRRWRRIVGVARPRREFPLGHVMDILYVPSDPKHFKLNTPEDIRGSGVGVLGAGAFAAVLFTSLALFVRRALRRPGQYHLMWWDRWFLPLKIVLRLLGQ